ncbi:MAG: hypothetical protein AAGO57_02740, partial [Pseudomonadota bacterium]
MISAFGSSGVGTAELLSAVMIDPQTGQAYDLISMAKMAASMGAGTGGGLQIPQAALDQMMAGKSPAEQTMIREVLRSQGFDIPDPSAAPTAQAAPGAACAPNGDGEIWPVVFDGFEPATRTIISGKKYVCRGVGGENLVF